MVDDLQTLAAVEPLPLVTSAPPRHALVAWAIVLGGVLVYELWALATHHQTLSQGVQQGPRWFKWTLGLGLCGLMWHLFR